MHAKFRAIWWWNDIILILHYQLITHAILQLVNLPKQQPLSKPFQNALYVY
jgi:hypothetical protein